jgi:Tfp pilus assembly protein PilF
MELEQAAKLDPKNATIVNNLGFTLYKVGKFWESITWFQKAIAIDPLRAIAYLNLADAYVRVGKPREAKQNYEKFLLLSPNSANADEVRQRIVELQDKQ